jgi:hypothetical protein
MSIALSHNPSVGGRVLCGVVTLSIGRGCMRRPLVYRSISKMSTRMGRYRQITCTGPISRMSESMTSSIEVNTASMTVGSTSIAPRSDAGCLGKDRVGRSSHYSDARRSVDSHHSTPGPIVDKSAPVTPTSKNHRRADSLRGRLHRRPHNFENLCHWN